MYDFRDSLGEVIEGYADEFTGKEDDVQAIVLNITETWKEIQYVSEPILKMIKSIGDVERINEEVASEMELKSIYSAALFDAKYY